MNFSGRVSRLGRRGTLREMIGLRFGERQIEQDYGSLLFEILRRRETLGGKLGFWKDPMEIEREI